MNVSFAECSARERLTVVVDAGTFREWLPPSARVMSPHLAQLGVPAAFDDGVAIGCATLAGRTVFVAAQEGEFMGGGVGEVHGAKLVGLLRRALRDRPDAVVLLAESGGVRLHEANAGLIAVSEVMRALLDVRAAGIATLVLIGGANGCFGGMGIVARCADTVVMSDIARHAMSGPEVIESSAGAGEFDSRDRALVWRTTGGKHRWLSGDCRVPRRRDRRAGRASPDDAGRVAAGIDAAAVAHRARGRGRRCVRVLDSPGRGRRAHRARSRCRRRTRTASRGRGRSGERRIVMDWPTVAARLFGNEHAIVADGEFLGGTAATWHCARRARSWPPSRSFRAGRSCCSSTRKGRSCAGATNCWASTVRWRTWDAASIWRAGRDTR
jgi:malonate decarboxylase beta subunit